MVELQITVKGYFTLAAGYEEEAEEIRLNDPDCLHLEWDRVQECRKAAERCREKAYDLQGVVTLPAPKQQRNMEEIAPF